MQKVILTGNIGKDRDVFGEGEKIVVRSSIATTKWNRNTKKSDSVWHSLVSFSDTAKQSEQVFKKGNRLYIEGELAYSEYKGKPQTDIVVRFIEVQKFADNGASGNSNENQNEKGSDSSNDQKNWKGLQEKVKES